MGIAVFDPTAFKARYPEFAAADDAWLSELFQDATLYLDNTDCSIIQDVDRRLRLLNMIVAHLVKLSATAADHAAGGQETVGRITSATQGSVSVSTDYKANSESASFWTQTQYGAQYWNATRGARTFRHVPGPRRYMGVPGAPGWGRRF